MQTVTTVFSIIYVITMIIFIVMLYVNYKDLLEKKIIMTKEYRELLLKDLCSRLPYGVKVHLSKKHNRPEEDIVLNNIIVEKDGFVTSNIIGYNYLLSEIKPYLRSLSSMTEEEIKELSEIDQKRIIFSARHLTWHLDGEIIDYLNEKMFDWRGLIPKGLALEAKEGMYK